MEGITIGNIHHQGTDVLELLQLAFKLSPLMHNVPKWSETL